MQSVPITTNIVSSDPTQARYTRYNIIVLCDKVCKRLVAGWCPSTPVSSTNKTDPQLYHDYHLLYIIDMIFIHFKAEFFFSDFTVLPLRYLFYSIFNTSDFADFRFFVVLVKSGLIFSIDHD